MSAEDPRPDVATRIAEKTADTVLEKNQRHWSFDRRIPIIAVGTFMVAAIGYVYLFGEMRQSFADVVDKTAAHEIRIRGLEVDLGQTNQEVATVRGKLEGLDGKLDVILNLLQNTAYRPPHRPVSP